MKNSDKENLARVGDHIRQAKQSLENVEDLDVPKTLEMGFVDQIPLGQFPEETAEADKEPQR